MSFVFYDTETTGLNTSFDQITHFAAIRTDVDLNEVERFEARCRLLPYIVPSPEALCVQGVGIEALTNPALPSHYEMICAIRAKLEAWSPAIFLGYNALRFDEHLLRQAFYQNLFPPYLTNTGGNRRADVMGMAQACRLLVPNAISFAVRENGTPVFSLASLAEANGVASAEAHDAMADAETTLRLCRRMAEKAGELWSNKLRFCQKAAVLAFTLDEPGYLACEFYGGHARRYPVTRVGVEPDNAGVVLALDLRCDLGGLASLSDDELAVRLQDRDGPVRRIRANAAPVLIPLDEIEEFEGVGSEELVTRAEAVRGDGELCRRLVAAHVAGRPLYDASPHVEEQLYGRWIEDEEEPVMRRFHAASWPERFEIVQRFRDPRLRQLGRRLCFVEGEHHCPEPIRRRLAEGLAARLTGAGFNPPPPWMTISEGLRRSEAMLETEPRFEQRRILQGYRDHLRTGLTTVRQKAFKDIGLASGQLPSDT